VHFRRRCQEETTVITVEVFRTTTGWEADVGGRRVAGRYPVVEVAVELLKQGYDPASGLMIWDGNDGAGFALYGPLGLVARVATRPANDNLEIIQVAA
jgi:hypothetical protein